MAKFGREIMLTATDENEYRTTRFVTSDCNTQKEADAELRKWLKDYPELPKIRGNQKIIDNTLGE